LDRAGGLDEAIGQRGLPMVDARDDAEVANAGLGHGEQYNGGVVVARPLCLCPMPVSSYLKLLAVVIIWGLNFTVSKWSLREFPVLGFTAMRFVLASFLLIAV